MNAEERYLQGHLPQELAGNVLTLKQLWVMLWARRYAILAMGLGLGAITAAVTLSMPRTYESTATLLVATSASDPVSGRDVSLSGTYTATQIEFMLSPVILNPVVETFRLTEREEYIRGYTGDGSPESLRRYAYSNLRERLRVNMGWGSSFLYITSEDSDPLVAAQIANAIADGYIAEQERRFLEPAKERSLRYADQLKGLKQKVDEAQAKVTAFRQRTGLIDLNGSGEGVESSRLLDLDRRLTEATAQRREVEQRVGRVGESDATGIGSTIVQTLKLQLQQKEAQMSELRGSLGPRHPQIVSLQSEIDYARAQYQREVSAFGQGVSAELRAARDVEAKLASELEQQRKLVLESRAQQDEAARLLRELESTTQVYQGALDAFEKVQLGTQMAMSNVTIVNRAAPALRPVQRKAKKFTAGALVVGFGGGAGLMLLLELLNRRVRCREDIEHDLGMPVLIELKSVA